MKKFFTISLFALFLLGVIFTACKKNVSDIKHPATYELKPRYSSLNEFKQGISQVVNLLQSYRIIAYLDTMPNGFPDINGRKVPLSQFGYSILEKLNGNQQQIESGVYDVFHFDGATFSLISYIMKAQMVGDISAQTVTTIVALIPLPPYPVADFQVPTELISLNLGGGDCCKDNDCNPDIKILVTFTYKRPCGNLDKKGAGYAAGNKLTHMPSGKMYRFDAEISGCPCPGVLTSSITTPAGASYGVSGEGSGSVTLLPVSSGTYTITFTYKVCDKEVTKTFTLSIG